MREGHPLLLAHGINLLFLPVLAPGSEGFLRFFCSFRQGSVNDLTLEPPGFCRAVVTFVPWPPALLLPETLCRAIVTPTIVSVRTIYAILLTNLHIPAQIRMHACTMHRRPTPTQSLTPWPVLLIWQTIFFAVVEDIVVNHLSSFK